MFLSRRISAVIVILLPDYSTQRGAKLSGLRRRRLCKPEVNLAIPIIFAFLYFKVTNERNAFLTGLTATIPSLTFHTYISADYFVNNLTGADSFAFFAQWEMAGWVGPTFSISSFLVRRFVFKGLGKVTSSFLGFLPCLLFYFMVLFDA